MSARTQEEKLSLDASDHEFNATLLVRIRIRRKSVRWVDDSVFMNSFVGFITRKRIYPIETELARGGILYGFWRPKHAVKVLNWLTENKVVNVKRGWERRKRR